MTEKRDKQKTSSKHAKPKTPQSKHKRNPSKHTKTPTKNLKNTKRRVEDPSKKTTKLPQNIQNPKGKLGIMIYLTKYISTRIKFQFGSNIVQYKHGFTVFLI